MTNEQTMLDITPDTRLAHLLEKYPQCEQVLLDLSPVFAKLKNPLLRKTIAKVATLRQVAQAGKIPLVDLINKLRKAVGMAATDVTEEKQSEAPDWLDLRRVVQSFDAREMLASGGHPLSQVLSDIQKLKAGQIYALVTPFVPAPLIDVVRKKGYQVWSEQAQENEVNTYIHL